MRFNVVLFVALGLLNHLPVAHGDALFQETAQIHQSASHESFPIRDLWHVAPQEAHPAVVTRHTAPRLEGGDLLLDVLRTGLTRAPLLLLLGFVFISREGRHKEKLP